jgi:2-amino-4-hydroxy-6-hydroxymethyldihydropteridine diphosphokinase
VPQVYVSIGSNQSPRQYIREGLARLESEVGPLQLSPVYRSVAVGFEGEDFFNLVIGFSTSLPLQTLAQILRDIEAACGRHRGEAKFAPRTLDMDILTYGEAVLEEGRLRLPREDILEYAFVLRQTYAALWATFAGGDAGMVEAPGFLDDKSSPC